MASYDIKEKDAAFAHIDEAVVTKSEQERLDDDPEFSRAEQRRIIHRVDRRLITTTGFMYCISLMDRTNLGNAAIAGMTVELKLNVGFRYVCLEIFPVAMY